MSAIFDATNLYGKDLRAQRIGPFSLHERVYPADFRTPRHSHDRPLFCYVVQGSYTETYGSKTRECKPSTFLFHAPGEPHAECSHRSGWSSFLIEIENSWLERLREHSRVIDTSFDSQGGVLSLLATRLYNEFIELDDISHMIIEGLMFELVGEASRCLRSASVCRPPGWLKQAKQLLHDRFAEQLTLAEIAQSVGVHPVHLAQVFPKYFNCTVGTYIRQRRIEYACQALADTDTSLSQIALAAGFFDQSHLTRMFKRQLGIPPAQYRELLRKC
jgi:AraC family transcriptional regulator